MEKNELREVIDEVPSAGEQIDAFTSGPQAAPQADFQDLGRPQNKREEFLIELIDRYRAMLLEKMDTQRELVQLIHELRVEIMHSRSLLDVLRQETPNLVGQITFSGFPPPAAGVDAQNKSE
jgi:DNA topoisomerase VI subunit A